MCARCPSTESGAGLMLPLGTTTFTPAAPFGAANCKSGCVEGGTADSFAPSDSRDTVQRALARDERSMLGADAAQARSALTIDGRDRKVWTYYSAKDVAVAEVVLERSGEGWRALSAQQCAADGVEEIQQVATAQPRTGPDSCRAQHDTRPNR